MNKYEEKFKSVIISKVTSLESKEVDLKQLSNSFTFVIEMLKSLQEVPFAVQSEFVKSTKKQLGELLRRGYIYKDEIARIKKELTILQSVCPHEDTTFDHKDYHKNEDYYKCNTCGMIV